MKKWMIIILASILILSGCGNTQKNESSGVPSPTASEAPDATTPLSQAGGSETVNIEDIAVGYVTDMANGDYKKALEGYAYDDTMKKALTEPMLKDQIWGAMVQTYGPFKEITGTLPSKSKGFDIISVKTTFENAKLFINVVFDSNKLIAGLNYTVDPNGDESKIPDGVNETEVKFGEAGWELPGTLTTPDGDGPFPVVVLVQGSGPNDRNETVGPNKPFRDIAWGLAQKGIATLRYDKRTYVYKNKMAQAVDLTVNEETVNDAVLAVKFLETQDKMDKSRIFVLGHSLGAMMMPRIAGLTPDAAGYILMSGAVTPLEDVLVYQYNYLSELDGTVTDEEKKVIQGAEDARDKIKSLTPDSKYAPAELFGIPASYWLDLKNYNPAEVAKSIEKPLLILQGERDYQVTMDEFNLWKAAVGSKKNVTMKSYEGLDHMYLYGTGKSDPQQYNVPGSLDSGVISDIGAWILK